MIYAVCSLKKALSSSSRFVGLERMDWNAVVICSSVCCVLDDCCCNFGLIIEDVEDESLDDGELIRERAKF